MGLEKVATTPTTITAATTTPCHVFLIQIHEPTFTFRGKTRLNFSSQHLFLVKVATSRATSSLYAWQRCSKRPNHKVWRNKTFRVFELGNKKKKNVGRNCESESDKWNCNENEQTKIVLPVI